MDTSALSYFNAVHLLDSNRKSIPYNSPILTVTCLCRTWLVRYGTHPEEYIPRKHTQRTLMFGAGPAFVVDRCASPTSDLARLVSMMHEIPVPTTGKGPAHPNPPPPAPPEPGS